jgi:hypothetical protein
MAMNRFEVIASRVAVKFDTKKELETYRREHHPKPGTKLELRNPAERKKRYEDRKRHGASSVDFSWELENCRKDARYFVNTTVHAELSRFVEEAVTRGVPEKAARLEIMDVLTKSARDFARERL